MKTHLLIVSLFLVACQQAVVPDHTNYMVFVEQEEGIEPYQTRLLVNKQYLRFDDGENSISYLLMDRSAKKIYNINHQTKTAMILEMKTHDAKSPFELKHTAIKVDDMKEAPSIQGKQPVHYQLFTNEQHCLDVVSVEGLLPEAIAALKEYHLILASDSATTIQNIPADMQEPCMLAMTTFAPVQYLQYGFPVQEWKQGYARHLMDYKLEYEAPADAFIVPADYFQYTVKQFRDGQVDLEARTIVEN